MRNFEKYIVIIFAILFLSACGKASISKDGSDGDKGKEGFGLQKLDLKCEELKDIKDYADSLFITKDGAIYRISFTRLFSNEKNCMKLETDVKGVKFFYGGKILGTDNELYYFDSADATLEKWSNAIKLSAGDKYENLYVLSGRGDNGAEIYFEDNHVYYYKDGKKGKEIFTLKDDEKLEYIVDYTIKTDKRIYVFLNKKINEEECEKYADVKCITEQNFYELDNPWITDKFDDVLFYKSFYMDSSFGSVFLIDKQGNLHQNLLGG